MSVCAWGHEDCDYGNADWQDTRMYPEDDTWCWVSDGNVVWLAKYSIKSAGGWTNEDTWEDFDGKVTHYIPLEMPRTPKTGRKFGECFGVGIMTNDIGPLP